MICHQTTESLGGEGQMLVHGAPVDKGHEHERTADTDMGGRLGRGRVDGKSVCDMKMHAIVVGKIETTLGK
jgi:hypothetical protein